MVDRRKFLQSAGAGLAFCGCELAGIGMSRAKIKSSSKAAPRLLKQGDEKPLTVDIHAHAYVHDDWPLIKNRPEARDLDRIINSPLFEKLTSVEDRIAEMDREGIDIQAVSLYVGQYHYWAERELAKELVQVQNKKLAEICAEHPDRFVGLGAVALAYPDLAAEQMVHAVENYDFRGFMVTGSVDGEEISAPRFDAFWAKAEELDTLIFIHPRGFSEGAKRLEGNGWLENTIGNPLETTVALSHMIFDGFLDRFPRLKICAAHGGGYLPTYVGRSDNCYSFDPRCQQMELKPSEYLKKLYFDTVVYSPRVLRHLIDEVGADRVVIGTDHPFPVASKDPVHDVLNVPRLSDEERNAILGATAARILKIT